MVMRYRLGWRSTLFISHLVHGLDRSDMIATLNALEEMGLPIFDSAVESGAIFDGLEEFRQHLGGRLTLTMLRGVGNSINVHEVDRMAMLEAIRFLQDRVTTRPSPVAP